MLEFNQNILLYDILYYFEWMIKEFVNLNFMHGIVMTVELEGRLERMCNLSQCVLERGYQKGLEEGRSLGIV